MKPLDKLKELHLLRQIASGNLERIDTNELERDFLRFSGYMPNKTLRVHLPRLYELQGEEVNHLSDAFKSLGIDGPDPKSIKALDFAGDFDHATKEEAIIIASLQQVNADHLSRTKSFLNPLLEQIYSEGSSLIRDFAVHEILCGKVSAKSDGVALSELYLYPGRFAAGPYTLSVELDTPHNSVSKFIELSDILDEFTESPKQHLLDHEETAQLAANATELRKRLGSLSRYDIPKTRAFSATTNSYVLRTKKNTQFFIYSPHTKKNILVYFGDTPFEGIETPRELLVLSGKEHEHTLITLIEHEIFEASREVLASRLSDLNKLYDNAARGEGRAIISEHPNFGSLLETLNDLKLYLGKVLNPRMAKKYLIKKPAEILEFLVYPTSADPVIHELLPRLSWNRTIRTYHNTGKFIYVFDKADADGKKELVNSVASSILFSNYQNNDVNVWLFNNYRDLCSAAGVNFEVLK